MRREFAFVAIAGMTLAGCVHVDHVNSKITFTKVASGRSVSMSSGSFESAKQACIADIQKASPSSDYVSKRLSGTLTAGMLRDGQLGQPSSALIACLKAKGYQANELSQVEGRSSG